MVVFYLASVVALAATFMAITRLNAVEALLYLIVSLLAAAVIFYQLGAPFLAALEVVIYAGAIMVLFVFVMMMLNLGIRTEEQERSWLRPQMFFGPAILAAVLGGGLLWLVSGARGAAVPAAAVGPKEVAIRLYTVYPIAVELAALLLLAGLVGAFHLGRGERRQFGATRRDQFAARMTSSPEAKEKVP